MNRPIRFEPHLERLVKTNPTPEAMPVRIPLDGTWTLRPGTGPVPADIAAGLRDGVAATVPGVVHTDLLAAGLILDPFDADNEATLGWIGWTDWEYRRSFEFTSTGHDRHDLVAEGLDTVATIWLNGVEIARTANHHRTYRVDVRQALREGTNDLRIVFSAAARYARHESERLGPRPLVDRAHPFNAIRKPAYSFGWDWGPEIVTAGIWRSIAVESWSGARIAAVRPLTSYVPETGAALDAYIDVETADVSADLFVRVQIGDAIGIADEADGFEARVVGDPVDSHATVPVSEGRGHAALAVPAARPWWPRTHGDQPLYPAVFELVSAAGTVLDRWSTRIGFRTVTLDTTPDEVGNAFCLRVNGCDVYVRGVNWIPASSYLPSVTTSDLNRALDDAVDANVNLVRVWGGGIYESEDFYGRCDEKGLLVWQDFLLACAAYAEEEPLAGEMEAEAREAVTRLAGHASLALLCGGNENLWGYASWGWRRHLQGATWGDGYYRELFPRIVAELAPGTPYCPGSPSSIDPYLHPNDESNGAMHIWDVWNSRDYTAYASHRPRFVAEFGFQGPPAISTLRSVVHDVPLWPYGPQMLVHQKADEGNLKLERGLGDHLPTPRNFLDWHWATQLNQARAIRFGITYFRSLHPLNTGAILWQLNDCWPVVSWSAVDAHGIRKPLWYALREVFVDRFASVQPTGDGPVLAVHNDHPSEWRTTARAVRMTLAGTTLASYEAEVYVEPRGAGTVRFPLDVFSPGNPRQEFVVVQLGTGERALWYFVEDPLLDLAPDAVDASVLPAGDGYDVVVQARSLVKDLALLVDHVHPDARVDGGLVTLLPAEKVVFHVSVPKDVDAGALVTRPVLRTANDLVAQAGTSDHAAVAGLA
ncbi:glycoside hydrolase family 2 protein [Plantactinospora solaniradicis]|uniref:beta-mannosidase n=1 Tax=Plantactinospora solaniradicis TaxID=1723736 RepID=A0ABW1K4Q7_9ACTN